LHILAATRCSSSQATIRTITALTLPTGQQTFRKSLPHALRAKTRWQPIRDWRCSMNEMTREADLTNANKVKLVDCDIHPAMKTRDEMLKFMPLRWREHARDFGIRTASPLHGAMPYPRITPGSGMRRDAWPPAGGPPASDVAFLQEQLLDALGIDYGILQALGPGGATMNQGLGAAISSAMNDWQIEKWLEADKRLKGSICVSQEDPDAAVAEI